jgi:HD superfamily phosphohydrolase
LAFLAGLLHDIGHPTWGHVLDSIASFIAMLTKPPVKLRSKRVDKVLLSLMLIDDTVIRRELNEIGMSMGEYRGIKFASNGCTLSDLIYFILTQEKEFTNVNKCSIKEYSNAQIMVEIISRIIESEEGIGGIDTDRIDYILRDTYHTYIHSTIDYERGVARDVINKVITDILQGKKNLLELELENVPKINFSMFGKDFNSLVNIVRDMLYERLYESVARAFADSLLSRLAYATILTLLATMSLREALREEFKGEEKEGESHDIYKDIKKIVLGYLMCTPQEFIDDSLRLLSESKHQAFWNNIISLWNNVIKTLKSKKPEFAAWIESNIDNPENLKIFVENTIELSNYYYALRYYTYLVHDKLQSSHSYNDMIDLDEVYIYIYPIKNIIDEFRECSVSVDLRRCLKRLERFYLDFYIDAFRVVPVLKIEGEVNRSVKADSRLQDLSILLLPINYAAKYMERLSKYILDKLVEMCSQKPLEECNVNVEDFLKSVKDVMEYPLALIVFKTKDKNKAYQAMSEVFEALDKHFKETVFKLLTKSSQ